MKFHYIPSEQRSKADALLLPCFEEEGSFSYTHLVPEELLATISLLKKTGDFLAKKGDLCFLYTESKSFPRLLLLGLGPKSGVDGEVVRESYAALTTALAKKKLSSIVVLLPHIGERGASWTLQAAMEGMVYGSYQFCRYKKQETGYPELFFPYPSLDEFFVIHQRVVAFKKAMILTRDLVNMNANEKYPAGFCDSVLSQIEGSGIVCSVFDEKWIQQEKMGLLLAVGRGSATPPRMMVLSWKPCLSDPDHTVLVGKGITFDTGGLNVKPSGSIETMKDDMAGAAVVVGLLSALAEMNIQKNVTAVIPLAENSLGSRSYKPGDVFRARSGTTVEITNTDAEGRLILADALDWSKTELAPTRIIDVATLTGACEVALGDEIFGLFSNSDSLAFEFEKAATRAQEAVVRMPLYQGYNERLKSDIADCKNASSRVGGAILAALFLERFVGKLPWIHLDIAGTAFYKDAKGYYGKGATASPLRTLLEFFVSSTL